MHKLLYLSALTMFPLLSACDQADQKQLQNSVNEQFRTGFIKAANEKCMSSASKNNKIISQEKIQLICNCTANKLVDVVSADDLPNIMLGKISDELTATIKKTTASCIQENIQMPNKAASQ